MSVKPTTPAEEEYLEAIYRFSEQETPVSLGLIAQRLDISPVSVNEMVRRMADEGLVTYRPYAGATLTEQGQARAATIVRRHRLWERLLTDVLGVPWHLVHEEACRLEHATSDLLEERLAAFLADPGTCPHGQPLPGSVEQPEEQALLSKLAAGDVGRIVAVLDEAPAFLRALDEAGLRPGASVTLVDAQPALGAMAVRVSGRDVVIGADTAAKIVVVPQRDVERR